MGANDHSALPENLPTEHLQHGIEILNPISSPFSSTKLKPYKESTNMENQKRNCKRYPCSALVTVSIFGPKNRVRNTSVHSVLLEKFADGVY